MHIVLMRIIGACIFTVECTCVCVRREKWFTILFISSYVSHYLQKSNVSHVKKNNCVLRERVRFSYVWSKRGDYIFDMSTLILLISTLSMDFNSSKWDIETFHIHLNVAFQWRHTDARRTHAGMHLNLNIILYGNRNI